MKNILLELTNIVQGVALVSEPTDQVKLIVDSISQVIKVDVSSLYMVAANQDLVLLASRGLVDNKRTRIPNGLGLVGLVVQTRHPVNIADASEHPNYYFVKGIKEGRYKSFCGVPLVRKGVVIGVLTVQSRKANKLSEEKEAFLTTLASHLTLIIDDAILHKSKPDQANRKLEGRGGAAGIGIGVVHLCGDYQLDSVPDAMSEDVDESLRQLHRLFKFVQSEIRTEQNILGANISETVSDIFEAYHMLLSDQSLIHKIELEISAGYELATALRRAIHYYSEMFKAMEDPYLQARNEDIKHLGNKLLAAWKNNYRAKVSARPDEQFVLVGAQISVSDIANAHTNNLVGIVTKEGSSVSHVVILANALGIPTVMGIEEIVSIEENALLIVDGNHGQVILNPGEMVLEEYRLLNAKRHELDHQLANLKDDPAVTQDGERVALLTNTGLLADITPGINSGAEGIGLYRTELAFIVRTSLPTEEEQVRVYRQVFEAYKGKPVTMRTLDVGGDKQLPYLPITGEVNPALGWRGIRFSLDNIQLQMTQLRAMLRAAGKDGDLRILLPMVSSIDQIEVFSALLDDACAQLIGEGFAIVRPKMGVMLEVPAAISQLRHWAHKIDFASIGSNDLSQYLLALDRDNSRIAAHYDHLHPAVLSEIYRAVNLASEYEIELSICGEMASDPQAVLLLLGMGMRTLSMSANKLPRVKWLIRSVSIELARRTVEQALTLDRVTKIRALTQETLIAAGLGELIQ